MLAGEPLLADVEVVVPAVLEALAFVPVDFRGPLPNSEAKWCIVFGMFKIAAKLPIIFSPLLL
jgi:hypothetical protein